MGKVRTATVMFTDLVESTALSSRLGPARSDEFRRLHFQLAEEAIQRTGGRVVKSLGDGVMAAFDSAVAAVDAACAIGAMEQQLSREVGEPVRLRVGIANGDVADEDEDLFGEAVVQAARLCAAASDGQVLVTELVRLLVAGRGHEFNAVGMLSLKGLPAPVLALELVSRPLVSAVPLPHALSQRGLGFAGREAERAALLDAWTAAGEIGQPHAVVLCGESGAGKSALAAAFARDLRDGGTRVAFGACDADLQVPYGPWRSILGHLLRHADDFGSLPPSAGELGRLGPVFSSLLGDRTPTPSDPEIERYLLHSAVTEVLADRAPVLIVLDDLQWADHESATLLRRLFDADLEGQVLLVATYRTGEEASEHLATLLAALRRSPAVRWIDLGPMAETDIRALMEEVAGHSLDARGRRLAELITVESGGNAFFAEAILRDLTEAGAICRAEDGRWSVAREIQQLGLPASVRDVVNQRIARLGPESRAVLQALSVSGAPVSLSDLAAVTQMDSEVVARVLEEAAHAGMVEETPDIPVLHAFSHALIGRALSDDLGAARRQLLHERYARVFERAPGSSPGVVAHHWLNAGSDRVAAYTAACAAGRAALDGQAPADAVRWFTQARDLRDEHDREHVGLLLQLGEAQRHAGDPDHRSTMLQAAADAAALGAEDLVVQAALLSHRGGLATSLGSVDHDIVEMIRRALASPGCAGGDRARLLAQLRNELLYEPDSLGERHRLDEEAIALAEALGDDTVIAYALMATAGIGAEVAGVRVQYARARRAVEAARRTNDPALRCWTLHTGGMTALSAGDSRTFLAWAEEMATISASLGHPVLRSLHLGHEAAAALVRGDLALAEAKIVGQLELAPSTGYDDSVLLASIQLMLLRMQQGRLPELREAIAGALADTPSMVALRGALAVADIHAGDLATAAVAARSFEIEHTGYGAPNYTTSLALWSDVARALRDERLAALLLPLVQEDPSVVVCNGWTIHGVLRHHEAMLLDVLGQCEEADDAFADALATHERIGMPYLIAETALRWAEMLERTGRARDAEPLRGVIATICRAYGYRFWSDGNFVPDETKSIGSENDEVLSPSHRLVD